MGKFSNKNLLHVQRATFMMHCIFATITLDKRHEIFP